MRTRLTAAVLLTAAACSFDSRIDDELHLICDGGFPCPTGQRCVVSIGRCASIGDSTLGEPEAFIEPALGNFDRVFSLRLAYSVPLLQPPTAIAYSSGVELGRFTLVDGGGAVYDYQFQARDAGETKDGLVTVTADAFDRFGSENKAERVVQFTLDGTPPQVIGGSAKLDYLPAGDNPLANVTAMTIGTKVRFAFQVNEPLLETPRLSTGGVDFSGGDAGINAWSFIGRLDAGIGMVSSKQPITVEMIDLAGNVGSSAFGMEIDTEPPEVPNTLPNNAIIYRRLRWGSRFANPDTQFSVRARPDIFTAGDTVIVYPELEPDELGREVAQADAGLRVSLFSVDLARVEVEAVDPAGNRSGRALVRNVEWVATLRDKVPGLPFANPHRALLRPFHGPALEQPIPIETVDVDGAPATDFAASWVFRGPRSIPDISLSGAYDSVRARFVAFGVSAVGGPSETWEWDGAGWTQMVVPGPVGRGGAAIAFDVARGRTVMFGGSSAAFFNDTWEWDGHQWYPRQVTRPPLVRTGHAMTYDATRRRVVMFGGRHPSQGIKAETWEWDGLEWNETTTDAGPPPRVNTAMAYDPVRQQIVLFGGSMPDGNGAVADTWFYRDTGWTQFDAGGGGPPARSGHVLVWDSAEERLLLASGDSADVWAFDGTAWRLWRTTPHPVKGELVWYEPSADALRAHVMLDGGPPRLRTWQLSADAGVNWEGVFAPGNTPAARFGHASAWRDDLGVVVFGGQLDDGTLSSETWVWTGSDWVPRAGTLAPPRKLGGAVSDGQTIYLFGGSSDAGPLRDLWSFGPAFANWRLTAVASFAPRFGHAMFYDPASSLIAVHGGQLADGGLTRETWFHTGTPDASFIAGPTGPSLVTHVGAYDAYLGRGVVFGGEGDAGSALGDVWALDAGWYPLATVGGNLRGGMGVGLTYDPARRVMVQFGGGITTNLNSSALWELRNEQWRQVVAADPEGDGSPQGRAFHSMCYDPKRQVTAVFGGRAAGNTALDDLWELRAAGHRPAQAFEYATWAAGDLGNVRFDLLEWRGRIGAVSSSSDGGAIPGAAVVPWFEGRWVQPPGADGGVSGSSFADDGGYVEWRLTDKAALLRLLRQRDTVTFGVVPLGVEGATGSSVSADRAELELHYRILGKGNGP